MTASGCGDGASVAPGAEPSTKLPATTAAAPSADGKDLEESFLGRVSEFDLTPANPATMLLPFAGVPFPDHTTNAKGVELTPDGVWIWAIGWNWSQLTADQLPDGFDAGTDWSIDLSGIWPGGKVLVPGNAVTLFDRGGVTFFASSTCAAAPGEATSTAIFVERAGSVIAYGAVHETVTDCGRIPGQEMSAEQLVDLLAGLEACEISADAPPRCTALPPVSDEVRAAAAASLVASAEG